MHAHYFTPKLRGATSAAGWFAALITPSLFYQFEDQPPEKTAMDMLSLQGARSNRGQPPAARTLMKVTERTSRLLRKV